MSDEEAEKIEVRVVIMMDADGDFAIGEDEDEALKAFEDKVGAPTLPVRIVGRTMLMAPPEIEEGTIDIPDSAGTVEVAAEAPDPVHRSLHGM